MDVTVGVFLYSRRYRLIADGRNSGTRSCLRILLMSSAVVLSAVAGKAQTRSHTAPAESRKSSTVSAKAPSTFTLVGAGDIAGCANLSGALATARLIEEIPGTV